MLRSERSPEIALEVGVEAVAEVLVPLLFEQGLHETPGGICEDGTTCNRKLDWERTPEPADSGTFDLDAAAEATHRQGIMDRDRASDAARLHEHADARSIDFECVATALDLSTATWRKGLRVWGLVKGTGKGYITVYSLTEVCT
jgi:hypothetical protein